MKINFKKSYIATLLFPIVFIGCGGGGGGTTETPDSDTVITDTNPVITDTNTSSVTGTVPGTIIEAYCNDGSFYTTTSDSSVNSNEHPFTLKIPQDSECRFVMITNEKDQNGDPTAYTDWIITPISINSSTYLKLDKDINLGYVPLETPGSTSYTGKGVKGVLNIDVTNATVIPKAYDSMDIDGDGIPNIYEDDDGDGSYNKYDDDDDNDGIKDIAEINDDHDGDGIKDIYDNDDDNDGIKDEDDDDHDNDGIKDHDDDDDDNDGIKDDDDHDNNNDGYDDDEYPFNNNIPTSSTLPTSFSVNDGRLLASQCAQCHGTNGVSSNSWDSIRGEDNLYHEMRGEDPIMDAQAKGYTLDEANKMESWLNSL